MQVHVHVFQQLSTHNYTVYTHFNYAVHVCTYVINAIAVKHVTCTWTCM